MRPRLAAHFVVWWCALWALWFAFEGEWDRIEWIAAAAAASLGAALATLVRRRGHGRLASPATSRVPW